MSTVTTHVLDTARGRPAAGVPVRIEHYSGGGWAPLGDGVTDGDGRIRELGPEHLAAGTYRLVFDTASYFSALGATAFYPEVTVTFRLADPAQHYHVPLLLSPFAYSTYRGS